MQGYEPQAYGEAMAEVYDDWYADISDADATVAAVVELVRAAGGGPVLELGIGTGRLALPLAAAGLERAMLQHLDHRDLDAVRMIGEQLAPRVAGL